MAETLATAEQHRVLSIIQDGHSGVQPCGETNSAREDSEESQGDVSIALLLEKEYQRGHHWHPPVRRERGDNWFGPRQPGSPPFAMAGRNDDSGLQAMGLCGEGGLLEVASQWSRKGCPPSFERKAADVW